MSYSWNRSRQMLDRSRRSLAGGVSSPFRAKAPVPLFFESGRGARLHDVDGNEYVDFVMGFGASLFGHRAPFVVAAIQRQL